MFTSASLEDLLRLSGDVESSARRGELALRVADLFLVDAPSLVERQVALFDAVLCKLMTGIAETDRASLSDRLALAPNAPDGVIERLAFDDSIVVSSPVLTFSARLNDIRLVRRCLTGQQGHLFAVAGRKSIPEQVTDILVDRGQIPVLRRVAANTGARLSNTSDASLTAKAADDNVLRLALADRRKLSPTTMSRSNSIASPAASAFSEKSGSQRFDEVKRLVVNLTESDLNSATVADARATIQLEIEELHRRGGLDESQLLRYTNVGAQDHVVLALSILSGLAAVSIENARGQPRQDGILVICRALELSWSTTRAILNLKVPGGLTSQAMEQAVFSFERLTVETAKLALSVRRKRLA